MYGLARHLHVEAVYAPVLLAPEMRYGNPRAGVVYQFVEKGAIDVAAKVSATVNTGERGNWVDPLNAGFPVVIRVGGVLRIDTGIQFPLKLGAKTDEPNAVGLHIPLVPVIQIMPPIAAGVISGCLVGDFTDATKTMALPLGFSIFTFLNFAKGRAKLGLSPFFVWPTFVTPASGNVHTDIYVAGFQVALPLALPGSGPPPALLRPRFPDKPGVGLLHERSPAGSR